ncbi:MAG TPA: hypothetical protein VFF06_32905 [Polyangia bacterium]|nr:hypothetical protein [Polyangia bacterium]
MRKLLFACALAPAALAAGCGDGIDITGMYAMTASQSDGAGCGPGTAQTTPAFFQVVKQELLGVPLFSFKTCTSADPSTCTLGFGLLSEPIANGWKGELSIASGDAASCSLGYTVETAVVMARSLRYERHVYSENNVQGTQCKSQDATSRGTSMPCTGYVLLVGDRL